MKFKYLHQIWTYLIRPYWTSEDRWKALGLLGGHLALMGLFIGLTVRLNYLHNDFYDALQKFDSVAFFSSLGLFCGLASLSIVTFMMKRYLLQHLEIRWRRWMTEHFIKGWVRERRYYRMQLEGNGSDNPDQRIAEDISHFIDQSLNIGLAFLQQILTLGSFLGILWSLSGTLSIPLGKYVISIPGYMCWGAFLFAGAGTLLSFYFGKNLVKLGYENEKREANFRYGLVRFRDNMEGIALYQGEGKEKKILGTRLQDIIENGYDIIRRMLVVNSWTSFYGQAEHLFPLLLVAPRFFAKQLTLGTLMQVLSAFGQVSNALSFIVTNFPSLANWQATTTRLLEFRLHLESLPPSALTYDTHAHEAIEVTCETITLPTGAVVQSDVHLTFRKNEDTLITGPTGIGKSTLARVVAGIWPHGKGKVKVPSSPSLFLPQKPYMPLGTLREALYYPSSENIPGGDVIDILSKVGLEALAPRLDETNDWARVLSLGEQQRLAIARALIIRPQWIFLDEATSSMDERSEAALYQLLKRELPDTTLISIGHRESLRAFHNREIRLGEPLSEAKAVA